MQIYVDGLSNGVTETDLALLFSGATPIGSIRVIRDIASGESRGFALVTVAGEEAGKAAISRLNGTIFAGKQLTVFRVHDTLPGEMEYREWLRDNASGVLSRVGVAASQTVLDYGCGPGIFSIAAAKLVGPSGKVYATDVRQRALDQVNDLAVEEALTSLETVLLDKATVAVPLGNASADVVLLYDVMQEIPDKPALMGEMHRIVKPGGVVSVFPMHLGTGRLLELVRAVGLFQVRDRFPIPGFESASEIVNLTIQDGGQRTNKGS